MGKQVSPVDVLICEDHLATALGIEILLRKHVPRLGRVRAVQTGAEAIEYATAEAPGLAVIDLLLPDLPGSEVIRKIRSVAPACLILVLTGIDDAAALRQVQAMGVQAILRKTHTEQSFKEALGTVFSGPGRLYLDPSVEKLLEAPGARSITPREHEVLSLMARGLTSNEIALRMNCSVTTVKTYRSRIMNKSGARNSAEIMAWYLKGNSKGGFGSNP